MLEKELEEITEDRAPAKNLTYALIGLGISVLASLTSFFAMDMIRPGGGNRVLRAVVVVYYVLTIVSGAFAFLACKNSLISLRTNKNPRNIIALVIGGLLLLGIVRQVLGHL